MNSYLIEINRDITISYVDCGETTIEEALRKFKTVCKDKSRKFGDILTLELVMYDGECEYIKIKDVFINKNMEVIEL